MMTLPLSLQTHLSGDATTTCHAWRVTRRDGVVLGLTEHDRDLSFDNTLFLAASGFQASEAEALAGLAAGSGEVSGAFSSSAIQEEDVVLGRYDGATVEQFLVNWADPSSFVLLQVSEIGDVTRSDAFFKAELRSRAARLDAPQGRVYGHRCDADLGDLRCGVNVGQAPYTASASVIAVLDQSRIAVSGLASTAPGFFRFGLATFLSGGNLGLKADIENHLVDDGQVLLSFWLPLPGVILPGDAVSVVAGCDKSFETCRSKFANQLNFQGFPHLPGTDFAYSYADGVTVHDGRPLYE